MITEEFKHITPYVFTTYFFGNIYWKIPWKMNNYESMKRLFLPHFWSNKGFKGTVVNQTLSSLHGGSRNVRFPADKNPKCLYNLSRFLQRLLWKERKSWWTWGTWLWTWRKILRSSVAQRYVLWTFSSKTWSEIHSDGRQSFRII